MIYIFHGDDTNESRQSFNRHIDSYKDTEILRLDGKEIEINQINLFLNSPSMFLGPKIAVLNNLFSANKAILDKAIPLILSSDVDIIIWQDKVLTVTQLKAFPQAKISLFKLENQLFSCTNSIKPHNLNAFIKSYETASKLEMYDLLLYLIKGNLRRQLAGYSRFDQTELAKAYLRLVELDFQNKTGTLAIPKELALERIMVALVR